MKQSLWQLVSLSVTTQAFAKVRSSPNWGVPYWGSPEQGFEYFDGLYIGLLGKLPKRGVLRKQVAQVAASWMVG